jgi:hypothetical protein
LLFVGVGWCCKPCGVAVVSGSLFGVVPAVLASSSMKPIHLLGCILEKIINYTMTTRFRWIEKPRGLTRSTKLSFCFLKLLPPGLLIMDGRKIDILEAVKETT